MLLQSMHGKSSLHIIANSFKQSYSYSMKVSIEMIFSLSRVALKTAAILMMSI